MMLRSWLSLSLACALAACTSEGGHSAAADVDRAVASLSAQDLLKHMRVLSSDEFEGRAPGTAGDKKTVDYLVSQFTALGLAPGNPDGSYVQRVPLMGFTTTSRVSFETPGGTIPLRPLDDYVAMS